MLCHIKCSCMHLDAGWGGVEDSMCDGCSALRIPQADISSGGGQQQLHMGWLVTHDGPVERSEALVVL